MVDGKDADRGAGGSDLVRQKPGQSLERIDPATILRDPVGVGALFAPAPATYRIRRVRAPKKNGTVPLIYERYVSPYAASSRRSS